MGKLIINDKEMYQYFDYLFYEDEKTEVLPYKQKLKPGWRQKGLIEPSGLTNHNVYEIFGSKRLLYGEKDARAQLCVLDGMQKFLHEYVGIEGLEELLINNYGTIENGIFLEHDANGDPVHIREHAKHQMKNAFLGSIFLLEYGYLEDIAKNILAADSLMANYLSYQGIATVLGEEKLPKDQKELLAILVKPENRPKLLGKLQEWVYKIFMVSSMLHDIGYPLEYYLRTAKTLTEYPPYLEILSPMVKTDFAQIKAKLLDSQLFHLIDHVKIRQKYDADNHGVLSALSLLMHFYHNGKIYSLSREQRCLIEMSAIAIYCHTDKFKPEYRMVYQKDPISYMVRLCDDLQEWERFKVIMNDKHNYLQCGKCGKLILSEQRVYQCPCCGQSYVKVTQINNRKLNYICLCDELLVEKEKEQLIVTIHFNLLKQFEILMEDYTAVIRRASDLSKVEEMLEMQSMKPKLKIEYFVSNNPYSLISQMLEKSGKNIEDIFKWIDSFEEGKKKENMKHFIEDYQQNKDKKIFGNKIEMNSLKYQEKAVDYVKRYYGEVFCLYQHLYSDIN